MKNIIEVSLILIVIATYFFSCSSVKLNPKDDDFLCYAFEEDSKEMLGNYFEQWSNDIRPITIDEKLNLSDTIQTVYKIFEDYINYYIDKYGMRKVEKPYTMIQNEINFSISNLDSLTFSRSFKIKLLSLIPLIYKNLTKPALLMIDKDSLISLIRYPVIARRAGVQGDVKLEFYVDYLGNLKYIKVLKGIGAGCDESVIKAIQSIKFTPAEMNGKKVGQNLQISVRFSLGKDELRAFNSKLNKSFIISKIIHNFRPLPIKLKSKPVYVTKAKESALDKFIRSDCGEESEQKYNDKYWKGWPRASFIEQVTHLSASLMGFHYHSIPYISLKFNKSLNKAIILSHGGSSFSRDLFKLKDNTWKYIKTISFGVE